MSLSFWRSKFLVSACLFGFWGFLRFFLMMRIRGLLFQIFGFEGGESILLNHGLIVLEAALLFGLFELFRKFRRIEGFHFFTASKSAVFYGLFSGLFIFVTTIPVAYYFGMKFSPQFAAVGAIGNLFSNGAEELIYRGILFSAAALSFRNSWLSVAVTAVAFGIGHWDLPYLFQAYIIFVGLILGWTYLRTKSLAAPYMAHMIADVLADSLFH